MKLSTLVPATIALTPADAPQPFADQVVRAHNLATLSEREAQRLEGRRAHVIVTVDSRAEFIGRYTAFDAVAPSRLHGGVFLIGWVDDPDKLPDTFIVEATAYHRRASRLGGAGRDSLCRV
jgi:hypothetical protein